MQMFRTGTDAEPGLLGALPPWHTAAVVREWARRNPKQACAMWAGDAQWRAWLTENDRELAEDLAEECGQRRSAAAPKPPMVRPGTDDGAAPCRLLVRGGHVIATCRIALPGGAITLTATCPIEPLRKVIENQTGSGQKAKQLAQPLAAKVAVRKLAAKAKAAKQGTAPQHRTWHGLPIPAAQGAAPARGGGGMGDLLAKARVTAAKAKAGDPKAQSAWARLGIAGKLVANAKAGAPSARRAVAAIAQKARAGDARAHRAATAISIASKLNVAARGGWHIGSALVGSGRRETNEERCAARARGLRNHINRRWLRRHLPECTRLSPLRRAMARAAMDQWDREQSLDTTVGMELYRSPITARPDDGWLARMYRQGMAASA